jgi:hypothetical protein
MTALPNPSVALADRGRATSALREVMQGLSNVVPTDTAILFDQFGRATSVFRGFLQPLGVVVPRADEPLVNKDGTPTRTFTRLLMEAAR